MLSWELAVSMFDPQTVPDYSHWLGNITTLFPKNTVLKNSYFCFCYSVYVCSVGQRDGQTDLPDVLEMWLLGYVGEATWCSSPAVCLGLCLTPFQFPLLGDTFHHTEEHQPKLDSPFPLRMPSGLISEEPECPLALDPVRLSL